VSGGGDKSPEIGKAVSSSMLLPSVSRKKGTLIFSFRLALAAEPSRDTPEQTHAANRAPMTNTQTSHL
jgi:hypothetical protein